MGAEYTCKAAYGFASTEEVPKWFHQFEDNDDWMHDGTVDDWFAENGMDKITFHEGGDQWSGPSVWGVYAKDYVTKSLGRHGSEDVLIDLGDVDDDSVIQLVKAKVILGAHDLTIGWKLLQDVY